MTMVLSWPGTELDYKSDIFFFFLIDLFKKKIQLNKKFCSNYFRVWNSVSNLLQKRK